MIPTPSLTHHLPASRTQESMRYWAEINSGALVFDRNEREANVRCGSVLVDGMTVAGA